MALVHPPSLEDLHFRQYVNQFSLPPNDPFFDEQRTYFLTYIMATNRWTLEVEFFRTGWGEIRGWRDRDFLPAVCGRAIRNSNNVTLIHGYYLDYGSQSKP
ncbi:MAG: hypothetical protein RIF32_15665 [Leptospirales bacterium]|jgi:hypothetical protein